MTSTKYSISAASRITGKGRATISRHCKAGKLSYTVDAEGNKQIEASELLRVYGDECDFAREEKRGQRPDGSGANVKNRPDTAAVEAVQERLIRQYAAQVEHLQQALEKAQEGQNRVTLLLEQTSSERSDWQESLDAMVQTITNDTDQRIEKLRQGHAREIKLIRHALREERSKTFWQRVLGK